MDHIKKDENFNKLRSCSTLNTIYHETQQEIATLGQQLFTKDGLIADLKAKLAKYESNFVVEGDKPCLVGTSKSLVDGLCEEIRKLKQKLKDSEMEAAQKLDSSKREIQGLQQKLREKEQELEHVRQRPEYEKDQEIQHLRTTLAERDRMQATKDVLYSSLAEEAEQLRAQLRATVHVCTELLGTMEEKKRKSSSERKAQVNEMTDSSEVTRLNIMVNKLQEENQQLTKRVEYVENLNSRWQKYDLSREEYVKDLCMKLKESHGLTGSRSQLSPVAAAAPGSTALLQQEISRLNHLLEEKMLECERLGREKEDLTLRDRERIQMLEQQVLAYVEDFKSERADRERAQGKIMDLQDEVGRLQLQIHTQNAKESQSTRRLHLGLKKTSRKQTETAEPLLRNSAPESSTKRPVSQSPAQGSTDLQCPMCLTLYDDNNTTEYYNHFEECAKL